jgi:hypothetical protein
MVDQSANDDQARHDVDTVRLKETPRRERFSQCKNKAKVFVIKNVTNNFVERATFLVVTGVSFGLTPL